MTNATEKANQRNVLWNDSGSVPKELLEEVVRKGLTEGLKGHYNWCWAIRSQAQVHQWEELELRPEGRNQFMGLRVRKKPVYFIQSLRRNEWRETRKAGPDHGGPCNQGKGFGHYSRRTEGSPRGLGWRYIGKSGNNEISEEALCCKAGRRLNGLEYRDGSDRRKR